MSATLPIPPAWPAGALALVLEVMAHGAPPPAGRWVGGGEALLTVMPR